jgi:hypothetical protein
MAKARWPALDAPERSNRTIYPTSHSVGVVSPVKSYRPSLDVQVRLGMVEAIEGLPVWPGHAQQPSKGMDPDMRSVICMPSYGAR